MNIDKIAFELKIPIEQLLPIITELADSKKLCFLKESYYMDFLNYVFIF